jgi:23S rRNA (uridine2552-2'-O)-methyltransferase
VSERLKGTGSIVGIDIVNMPRLKGVEFIQCDLRNFDVSQLKTSIDVVISDIAPNISGVNLVDDANMIDLLEIELSIVDKTLVKGGNYLAKCFQGDSLEYLTFNLKKRFKILKRTKPLASRNISKEVYVLGLNKI